MRKTKNKTLFLPASGPHKSYPMTLLKTSRTTPNANTQRTRLPTLSLNNQRMMDNVGERSFGRNLSFAPLLKHVLIKKECNGSIPGSV